MKLFVLLFSLMFALSYAGNSIAENQKALEKQAKRIISSFSKPFQKKLKSASQQKNAKRAIDIFYNDMHPIIARVNRANPGWTLKRVSLKPINKKYLAKSWEAKALRDMQAKNKRKQNIRKSRYSKITNGEFRYLKPQLAGSHCLACHGTKQHSQVKRAIKKLYPTYNARRANIHYGDVLGGYSLTKVLR